MPRQPEQKVQCKLCDSVISKSQMKNHIRHKHKPAKKIKPEREVILLAVDRKIVEEIIFDKLLKKG